MRSVKPTSFKRHIFVDFSNVVCNIQDSRQTTIDVLALISCLVKECIHGKRYVVGSDTLIPFKECFVTKGFNVKVMEGTKEMVVDDALCGAILMEQLKMLYARGNPLQGNIDSTFVIVTGDGNDNNNFPSFKSSVEMLRNLFISASSESLHFF
jgi:hypothetical protein